jgi:hypothetical protein
MWQNKFQFHSAKECTSKVCHCVSQMADGDVLDNTDDSSDEKLITVPFASQGVSSGDNWWLGPAAISMNSLIWLARHNVACLYHIIKDSAACCVFMLYFAAVTILLVEETSGYCQQYWTSLKMGLLCLMSVNLKCVCFNQLLLKWVMTWQPERLLVDYWRVLITFVWENNETWHFLSHSEISPLFREWQCSWQYRNQDIFLLWE